MQKILVLLSLYFLIVSSAIPADKSLERIRQQGTIRHLGVPYARFNTGNAQGFSADLVRLFADYLKVDYEYVPSDFSSIISDLTGHPFKPGTKDLDYTQKIPPKGDIIATGFTILPWRAELLAFSEPIFPTQIWLIAPASSDIEPIEPGESIEDDIDQVRALLAGQTVLGMRNTCLDPKLYELSDTGAEISFFNGSVNDLIPGLLDGGADALILDVPDVLVGLSRWPGKIKIIGPISQEQRMADAFRKEDELLRQEYNRFLLKIKDNGKYLALIKKHYPNAPLYFHDFFYETF